MYVCLGRNGRARRDQKDGKRKYSEMQEQWERDMELSITKATRKQLDKAWERWNTWIQLAKEDDPTIDIYHPPYQVYCTFINYYLSLYKPSTVRTYLKRTNTAARERGKGPLISPRDMIWVKRTFKAAAKRLGHTGPEKRLPLTVDILSRLRRFVDLSTNNGRALWTILCVGVFALARVGELVPSPSSELQVPLSAVSIRGEKGSLFLVGTKTDSERKGVTLFFFRNNSPCCPLAAMQGYLAGRPKSSAEAPLFVNSEGKRLTQAWVVAGLRKLLTEAGLKGADYSGISFRRGGAQTLLRMKANDTIIMGMGRWTSSCFNRYLRVESDDNTPQSKIDIPLTKMTRKS